MAMFCDRFGRNPYAPSAEHLSNVMLGVTLAFAGVSGVAAAWLTIKRKRDPGSRMFQSKAASTVALCVAACVTLVVLFGVVG
jgi:hypothetical protein